MSAYNEWAASGAEISSGVHQFADISLNSCARESQNASENRDWLHEAREGEGRERGVTYQYRPCPVATSAPSHTVERNAYTHHSMYTSHSGAHQ